MTLGASLYSDSSKLGAFTSKIGFFISIVFGALFIIGGAVTAFGYGYNKPSDELPIEPEARWWVGPLFILLGLFVIGLGYLNYYAARKYKMYAAGQGASTAVRMLSGAVRG